MFLIKPGNIDQIGNHLGYLSQTDTNDRSSNVYDSTTNGAIAENSTETFKNRTLNPSTLMSATG